jgi:hypothetical protein
MIETEDFLSHYGVLGMKWGVRKERTTGVSRKVDRDAKKDANEFARAKMFYGDGAGTRRKLIKAKVEEKSNRSSEYKKAFDEHISRQDMSKHADKASSERKSVDRKDRTKKQAGYVARRFTGEMGTQAAFMAVAVGGAAYLNSGKGRAHMQKSAAYLKNAYESRLRKKGADKLYEYLK